MATDRHQINFPVWDIDGNLSNSLCSISVEENSLRTTNPTCGEKGKTFKSSKSLVRKLNRKQQRFRHDFCLLRWVTYIYCHGYQSLQWAAWLQSHCWQSSQTVWRCQDVWRTPITEQRQMKAHFEDTLSPLCCFCSFSSYTSKSTSPLLWTGRYVTLKPSDSKTRHESKTHLCSVCVVITWRFFDW